MIQKFVGFLVVMAFTLSLATVALARGAPTKKAFTAQAAVSVDVSPIVANVPPMVVGYDVIENLPAYPRLASANQYIADTSDATRLSPTVDWRSNETGFCSERSGPLARYVLRS